MKKHNEWTKGTTLLRRVLLILVSFLLIGVDINASYSLRQFSSKNGLSRRTTMCFGYRLIMGSTALIHADRPYKASKTLNT